MYLSEIIKLLAGDNLLVGCSKSVTCENIKISEVTADSRKVKKGSIFCAIAGSNVDGNKFIPQAVAAGAQCIISATANKNISVPVLHVSDDYMAFSLLVRYWAGAPDADMSLTAVTGTNGKTTSVYALHALDADPETCGIMTTIMMGCGGRFASSRHTTPDAETFFSELRNMYSCGCRRLYFEASSHSLAQSRMGNARIQSAIFTNLTQDHLDYHVSMENYYQAKKRLFTHYLADGGKAIINSDDCYGKRLLTELAVEQPGRLQIHDFGSTDAEHELRILTPEHGMGCRFVLDGKIYTSNLTGSYNAYNLAGAVLASSGKNIPSRIIVNVPGRLEGFCRDDGAKAFVDFAHTDDALKRVLTELRRLASGRLIVVFGAGGDRDRSKRPKMGKAVAELADVAIVTSDNPRSEDPELIIADILCGMNDEDCMVENCCDRAAAIRKACSAAGKGDIILVAGKGHETTQETAGGVLHFSDADELRRHGFNS